MSDDIEAFLRRAAERRKAAAAAQNAPVPQAPPMQPPPQAPPPTIARPFESSVGSQSLNRPQPAQTPRPQSTQKRQRQNKQKRPGSLANQRPQLAQNDSEYDPAKVAVDQADERMEAHLQSAFDHRVGNLAQAATNSPLLENGSVTAQSLLNLLKQPGGIQAAILLREILDRPVHRWQKPQS